MKTNKLAIFALSFALAFGGGYLVWNQDTEPTQTASDTNGEHGQQTAANSDSSPAASDAPQATQTSAEGKIFNDRGCLSCHSVSALGLKGGATGPDLSQAYVNVEGKHGVPLEEFLKKPTSAVMSGVLGGAPLSDEELQAVVAGLKAASEK